MGHKGQEGSSRLGLWTPFVQSVYVWVKCFRMFAITHYLSMSPNSSSTINVLCHSRCDIHPVYLWLNWRWRRLERSLVRVKEPYFKGFPNRAGFFQTRHNEGWSDSWNCRPGKSFSLQTPPKKNKTKPLSGKKKVLCHCLKITECFGSWLD